MNKSGCSLSVRHKNMRLVCDYLEASFLQRERVAGHFIFSCFRDGLPGNSRDRLCFLGQICFVVRETESKTWQGAFTHLQGSKSKNFIAFCLNGP